jgi:hypothetical protein
LSERRNAGIIFLQNGNTFAYDGDGNQLPEYQKRWMSLFLEYLQAKNIDVTQIEFEMPDRKKAYPFVCKDGDNEWFNWSIGIRTFKFEI